MRDPYLLPDVDVIQNLLVIKGAAKLEQVEAYITTFGLTDVDGTVAGMPFDLTRLCAIHRHVFSNLYKWAGSVRTIPMVKGERVLGGDTVRYSQPDDLERDVERVLSESPSVN